MPGPRLPDPDWEVAAAIGIAELVPGTAVVAAGAVRLTLAGVAAGGRCAAGVTLRVVLLEVPPEEPVERELPVDPRGVTAGAVAFGGGESGISRAGGASGAAGTGSGAPPGASAPMAKGGPNASAHAVATSAISLVRID